MIYEKWRGIWQEFDYGILKLLQIIQNLIKSKNGIVFCGKKNKQAKQKIESQMTADCNELGMQII